MRNSTRTLKEYKTFVVKIRMDMTPSPSEKDKCLVVASDNFDTLLDLELLLSLSYFQPLLTIVLYFIKFAQARNIFIYNFLQILMCVHEKSAKKYIDPITSFKCEDLKEYQSLLELKHPSIHMK